MLTSSHFLLHSSARAPNHLDKPLVAHQPTLLAIGRDGGDKLFYARKDGNTKWTGAKHSFNYFNIINDHYLHHFVVKIAIWFFLFFPSLYLFAHSKYRTSATYIFSRALKNINLIVKEIPLLFLPRYKITNENYAHLLVIVCDGILQTFIVTCSKNKWNLIC